MMITITVDEQVLTALCDAALRNSGINIFQGVAQVWNAVQQAKTLQGDLPPFMRPEVKDGSDARSR